MFQFLSGPCIYIYLRNGKHRFGGDLQNVEALKSFVSQHCRFVFPASLVLSSSGAKVWKEPNPLTETFARDLMTEEFKNPGYFLKMATSCSGVLFIDEVHNLDPSENSAGRIIVQALMQIIEIPTIRKQFSIIVAGYGKNVEEKFLAFDPGLKERFPRQNRLEFRDFNDDELGAIFVHHVMHGMGWRIDETCLKIPNGDGTFSDSKSIEFVVGRKLGRMRGPDPSKGEKTRIGFSNARQVENFASACQSRAHQRYGLQSGNLLTRADVIGQKVDVSKSQAIAELRALIGLEEVKKRVDQLVETANLNLDREAAGQAIQDVKLHKVFLGNPGILRWLCDSAERFSITIILTRFCTQYQVLVRLQLQSYTDEF